MKILFLFEYPSTGGSMSTQAELLFRGLQEHGVQCIPAHYEHRKKEKEWLYKTFRPDVVLGIGWWVDTPTIITEPQRYGLQPVPWLLADGWVANYHSELSSLPLVFTTSSWVKETYARDGVETKNFEVLHVSVDPNLFRPIPKSHPGVQEIRNMFGVAEHEKMILTVGGDVTSKGAQEIIRALGQIDKQYPNWKYVCKATDSDRAYNHHQEELAVMDEAGIDKSKVIYADDDFTHDQFMPYLLNACDIYAAPSRLEGFGMLQLEAMACGAPVISIDAMGPKDTVIHGETGFLAKVGSTVDLTEEWVNEEMGFEEPFKMEFAKPKTLAYHADVDDLAKHLLRLLTDDALAKRMGERGVEHARKNFHYNVLAKRCVGLLQEKLHIT